MKDEDIIKVYELLTISNENLSDRRAKLNTTFLSLNTAVLAVIAYILKDVRIDESKYSQFAPVLGVVPLVGFFVCLMWLAIVGYYLAEQEYIQSEIEQVEKTWNLRPHSNVRENLKKQKDHPSAQLTFYGVGLLFLNIYAFMTVVLLMPPLDSSIIPAVFQIFAVGLAVVNCALLIDSKHFARCHLKNWGYWSYFGLAIIFTVVYAISSNLWFSGVYENLESPKVSHIAKITLLKKYQPDAVQGIDTATEALYEAKSKYDEAAKRLVEDNNNLQLDNGRLQGLVKILERQRNNLLDEKSDLLRRAVPSPLLPKQN